MAIPKEKFTTLEMEVAEAVSILLDALADETAAEDDITAISEGIGRYAQQVERIGMIAGNAGLMGLQDVCMLFQEDLADLSIQGRGLTENERELLEEWPTLIMGYLESPGENQADEALIEHLQNPLWSTPLSDDEAGVMRGLLVTQPTLFSEEGEAEDLADVAIVFESDEEAAEGTEPIWVDEQPLAAEQPLDISEPQEAVLEEEETAELDLEAESQETVLISTEPVPVEEVLPISVEQPLALEEQAQETTLAEEPAEPSEFQQVAFEEEETAELDLEAESQETVLISAEPALLEEVLPISVEQPLALEEQAQEATLAEELAEQEEEPQTEALANLQIAPMKELTAMQEFQDIGLEAEHPEMVVEPESREETPMSVEPALPEELLTAAESPKVFEPEAAFQDEPAETATEAELLAEVLVSAEAVPAETLVVAEEAVAEQEAVETAEETTPLEEEIPAGIEATVLEEQTEALPVALDEAHQEVLDMLCAEVSQLTETAAEMLEIAVAGEGEARHEALTNYAEDLERLAEAAESVGLEGLHHVCAHTHLNLLTFASQDQPMVTSQRQLVENWPVQVLSYLQSLQDRSACESLVGCLRDPQWPNPLPADSSEELTDLLLASSLDLGEAEFEERQKQAQAEDVSLQLPEDVNPELLDSLLQELPSQTADFSAAVQRLIDGAGTLTDVDAAQRIAHTLKGAANTVGVRGIANLTHQIEDILLALSKHTTLPTRPLAETLLNAADCLETMSEALVGISPPPTEAQSVLQAVLDWANRIDQEGIPTTDELPRPKKLEPMPVSETVVAARLAEEIAAVSMPAPQPASTVTAQEPLSTAVPMLRVPAPMVDELLRLVGETMILTGQIQEQTRLTMQRVQSVLEQNLMFQQLTADLESLVDIQNIMSPMERLIPEGGFDPLELEQYNELHSTSQQLTEVATDSQEFSRSVGEHLRTLDTMLMNQVRLHRESQDAVIRTRMVPVKTVIPRLQRSVRQTCRLTDKETELYVNGADTLMDSDVLSDMTDPLMHVLRNAIDHGIEDPETRQHLGKPIAGRIDLSFGREGNSIVVRCQDDGAGLDMAAIRHAAEEQGLLDPGKTMEEEELIRLVLLPGFSTRKGVTQVSGRGIGLDAVHSRILEIKGSLNIRSWPGQGCSIELRLPVTLISTHALMVRTRQQMYAISERSVIQIFYAGSGQISKLGGRLTYKVGKDIYALSELEDLLSLPKDRRAVDRGAHPVLLVQEETGATRAILVEEILTSRDLVVKNLGQYIPKLRGIIGATILGDGSVAPVLDLPELLRTPVHAQVPVSERAAEPVAPAIQRHYALVVDDSLSARRSLAQLIEDDGFEVRTARDGLEAINIIDAKRPDILLVDLEMPRMNGLELTSHVRANEATRGLPIIMVTSRSTVKHRHEAEAVGVNYYFTKPFLEDELLKYINIALEHS